MNLPCDRFADPSTPCLSGNESKETHMRFLFDTEHLLAIGEYDVEFFDREGNRQSWMMLNRASLDRKAAHTLIDAMDSARKPLLVTHASGHASIAHAFNQANFPDVPRAHPGPVLNRTYEPIGRLSTH